MKLYAKKPKDLGVFLIKFDEYFSYTYLPIKLIGRHELVVENRLKVFDPLIGRVCCDFVGDFGLDEFVNSYVYLTAKHQNQRKDSGFNRPGWHSDGFGTNDISYIWSNRQPTIFNSGSFYLSDDDKDSMCQMEKQADSKDNYSFPNNSLIRMDQFVIHRVGEYEAGERCFMKICISKDKYNLRGNSINHELDYNWEYFERSRARNIPQR